MSGIAMETIDSGYQLFQRVRDNNLHQPFIFLSIDRKNPNWQFRPTPELRKWLEKERWDDRDGKPETNAALVSRKLEKLMEMEYQGY